jgi:RNA polymerase sporulation-specific sigma factor
MIGLMEALAAWNPASGMQFAAFASVCIDRQLDQAVRMATRKKHAALNYGARLDKLIRRNGGGAFAHEITLMDVLPLPATDEAGRDPLEAVLAVAGTAEAQQLIDDLRDCGLSALEATVFDRCILHQVPYRTLAAELSVGAKTVDNAMQRIMRKVRARALELSLSDRYSPELRATLRQCGQTKRHRGGGKSPDEWIGDLAKGA